MHAMYQSRISHQQDAYTYIYMCVCVSHCLLRSSDIAHHHQTVLLVSLYPF